MILEELGDKLHSLIYGPAAQQDSQLYPLPEKLSYLMKHARDVTADEAALIMSTPGYNILTPYFGLKLLDQQPQLQQDMLARMIDLFAAGANYTTLSRPVIDRLRAIQTPLHPVSAQELSRIATWGPATVDQQAQRRVQQAIELKATPVLIGYGGLLALRHAVTHAKSGDSFLIVLPKKMGQETCGYMITRSNSQSHIRPFNAKDATAFQQVALIDDAEHSGKTFERVEKFFPHARSHRLPLYRT